MGPRLGPSLWRPARSRFSVVNMQSHSTVIVLFGSSVPVWILACLSGAFVAVLLREVLILTGGARHMPALPLFHSAVALIAGICIYMTWIGGFR